jgi:ABC-2 type transport system ATP-binding protein
MLDLVGLTQRANDDLSTLSQGMRQRLSLATALLGGPEVLLLDEPLNGLDPVAQAAFRGLLRQLASNGASIVVSSHNLNELARFVDEVCILHMGRIVSIGTITEVERFLGIPARLEAAGLGTNPSAALTAAIEGVSVSELTEEEGSDWHLEIALHEEEWDTGRRAEVATVISESGAKLSHLSVVNSDLEHILEAATGLSAEEAGFAILSTEEAT